MTIEQMADAMQIVPSTARRWEKRPTFGMRDSSFAKLAQFLGLEWEEFFDAMVATELTWWMPRPVSTRHGLWRTEFARQMRADPSRSIPITFGACSAALLDARLSDEHKARLTSLFQDLFTQDVRAWARVGLPECPTDPPPFS
ncbi:MAG: hypothetical protein QOH64_3069 [Acidimicrobiaceae bacterium]|jgi:hypothetical protein